MSLINGVWHDAKLDLPPERERVLAVKELKNGRREICLAFCYRDKTQYDYYANKPIVKDYWVTGGGNNNVIYWMPLPKIPEV